jgi:predicted nucleotidyltransferase
VEAVRLEALPAEAREIVAAVRDAAREDERVLGVTIGGSAVVGSMDEFSDVDFTIVCADESHRELLGEAQDFAARLGKLLAAFTGEHVGEPRLLIALYGPPLLHVDLKFVALSELATRVEDALVVWERDGEVAAARAATPASWPQPDLQWIEDRFWVWIHYGATKLGRGELFECIDTLAALRGLVFGPLLAVLHGQRPQGVRRLERFAPDAVPALEATIGDHTTSGCAAGLRASIDLYRTLRERLAGPDLVRRQEAEEAVAAYLDALLT